MRERERERERESERGSERGTGERGGAVVEPDSSDGTCIHSVAGRRVVSRSGHSHHRSGPYKTKRVQWISFNPEERALSFFSPGLALGLTSTAETRGAQSSR